MNNDIKLEIVNNKELTDLFAELTSKNQQKVILDAFRISSKLILDEAKSNFQSKKKNTSKTDYKEILKSFKTEPMKSKLGLKVGVKYYKAHWINWGTEDRSYFTKSGVEHKTGKIERTDFFNDAVESKKEEASKMINDNIIISMERMIKKYNKK